MVGSMKTTDQDPKLNQKDSATEVDQKLKQSDTVNTVPQDAYIADDIDNQLAGDQLDLPLVVTDTLAMASENVDEAKKRKAKKEDAEQNSNDEKTIDKAAAESDQPDSAAEVEPDSEEAAEESLISEALDSESTASTNILGLSTTTLFLSAASLLGAASYYKNTNRDKAPSFASGSSADGIAENSGAGQVVYTAVALDDVEGGSVTYSLSNDSDSALAINSVTGQVTLNVDPNYEVQDQYTFTVIAADAAGNQSEQSVALVITNLDDTAPVISSSDTVVVDENSGAGQVVYTATADDSADISAGISFSLAAGSDAALSIDAATGEVTLATDPDFEAQSQYSFAVIATDAAGNASAAQSVTLDINNLDEVAPTITSGATAAAIDENSGAGQVVYTATADDSADISAGVSFSLAAGSDAALSIDTATGEVTLATDPDYEVQSQYSFAVIATDAAGNASTAQSVTLEINNLDDTAPIITSGATAAAIDENSGAGQVVYTATADDSADISAGVSFSLADGSDAGLTIDTATGEVSLTADPDYEAQSQYSFAVIATDAAGNASAAQSVTLDINNLDEVAPTITSGATAAAIDENSGAGQVVYTATADDSADISAGVSFSLTDGSDAALSIDAATGEVTLATDPDFEAQSQYSFAVIATDAAGNASAAQSVTLDINNLD